MAKQNRKVVKYNKPISINVGVIVFALLTIYLLIISLNYFSKDQVAIYEVTEKQIADDNKVTGIILRNEIVVKSKKAGYINYYNNEGNKIAKNSIIYTIDGTGKVTDYLSDLEETNPSDLNMEDIRNDISQYKDSFSLSHYNQIYDFKYNIENSVLESTNETMISELQTIMQQNGEENSFDLVSAEQSGIISYTIDGMEDLTIDQITPKMFENPTIERTQLRSVSAVEKDAPVYKIIPDESWSIIIHMTNEQLKKIQNKKRIQIKICQDNLTLTSDISTMEIGGETYAKLDLSKYMVRYIAHRFIEIELVINSADGLKLPVSSILKKESYKIPLSFLTTGGNSNDRGVVKESFKETGEIEYKFTPVNILMEDKQYYYIDTVPFVGGEWIRNSKTQERWQLNKMASFEGVYNVNEGYCKFRRIEKIYENSEYCIVKKDTKYGLAVYDHIVINPDRLSNNDLIY